MPEIKEKEILNDKGLEKLIKEMAKDVSAKEKISGPFFLVGIHTRGIPLAERLADYLGRKGDKIGTLDINLYRDDLSRGSDLPVVRETRIPFPLDGSRILLVDDVLFTGRTIRSALDALMDLGRPKKIELSALIDRGGRELPIQADYVGKVLKVASEENVRVRLKETDGVDQVVIVKKL